jgi:hypothetical protein
MTYCAQKFHVGDPRMSSFRIALVQPVTALPPDGPWRMPASFDRSAAIAEAAAGGRRR